MKKLYFLILILLSFTAFAEPTYIWDQPKTYGEGVNRQLNERSGDIRGYTNPNSYGEGMNQQLNERREDIRIYAPPKSYGEGMNRQLTEPASKCRYPSSC